MFVSICIPTCSRPTLLKEAVESCLAQSVPPQEIVIGDDSKSDETGEIVERLKHASAVPIHYQKNIPRLGQAQNTNSTYQRATGSHLILLHDDDLLLPNAVADLSSCWKLHPDLTAAFGKQYVISHDGQLDSAASETLNKDYFRTPDREGLQPAAWKCGLLRQFPNNGFMVTTAAARAILWRPESEDAGDFDFGLRLGLASQKFYFVNRYVSKYRVTQGAISTSRTANAALHGYRIIQSTLFPDGAEQLKKQQLARMAPIAMMQAIRHGYKKEAWEIYCSENHGWGRRFSLGGINRLARLLLSK